MKVQTLYICEVCGTEWTTAEEATRCEAYQLPPCPVEVGDKVWVYDRYDEPQEDQVTALRIQASDPLRWRRTPGEGEPFHEWQVETEKYHLIGKSLSVRDLNLGHLHRADGTCVAKGPGECSICRMRGV